MLSLRVKDLRNRNTFRFLERSRIVNKFVFINALSRCRSNLFPHKIFVFFSNRSRRLRGCSKIKITRRCTINNRGRGVVRSLGISRIHLRDLIQFGLVPGYTKAVW